MTMPTHLAHLVNASLEVERARQAVADEARDYATARAQNYTVDGCCVDALTKAGRRGVAILATDDGFDIVPIGDTEATVREIPPGSPKSWEESYAQISGENWERTKAENRAARPPGSNPPVHREGQRGTGDAARGPMTAAKLQALHEEHRSGQSAQGGHAPHVQPANDALMMRKVEEREEARMDAIERNKRRLKEELARTAQYAADCKAAGARM